MLIPAVGTLNPGKTMVQITAVKIAVDNLFGVGTEETILLAEMLIIDLFKINWCGFTHELKSPFEVRKYNICYVLCKQKTGYPEISVKTKR
jgi:hypothetical protein